MEGPSEIEPQVMSPLTLSFFIDDNWGLKGYYMRQVTSSIKKIMERAPPNTQVLIRRFSAHLTWPQTQMIVNELTTLDSQVDAIMNLKSSRDPQIEYSPWNLLLSNISFEIQSPRRVYVIVYTGCWLNELMLFKMKPIVDVINENKRQGFHLTFIQADRGISRSPRSMSPACHILRNECSRAHTFQINVGKSLRGIRNAFRKTKNHVVRWTSDIVTAPLLPNPVVQVELLLNDLTLEQENLDHGQSSPTENAQEAVENIDLEGQGHGEVDSLESGESEDFVKIDASELDSQNDKNVAGQESGWNCIVM